MDGSRISLVAARKPNEGKPHIELIFSESTGLGVSWLSDWLFERKETVSTVVIDGKSGAGALIEHLRERKFPPKAIIIPKSTEVATAASFLLNAITEERITHFNQDQLTLSALNAEKRPIGKEGAWGWGGSGDVDVTPIEAASLAFWGVMTTKRNPGKKLRIG